MATLNVTNSPQTYNGSPQSATVGITASSVPGSVANILTGGAATKTNAGTYAVTADFVPTDTNNYNALTGLSAGNFVIQKATPTATLTVTNSPVIYNGSPQAATVSISASSVPGTVANVKYNGSGTVPTNPGTYAITADFVPNDTTNYNTLVGLSAGNFVINAWTITGFYQPVDMNNVVNTVKGGSTVPLKFNIYAGNVERTSVSDVRYGTVQVAEYGCSGGPEDPMGDLPNTGATALRYDTTGHQFIQNWQTPKGANKCYRVRMTAIDGSIIEALFKTK
jgi:hypothetical protein